MKPRTPRGRGGWRGSTCWSIVDRMQFKGLNYIFRKGFPRGNTWQRRKGKILSYIFQGLSETVFLGGAFLLADVTRSSIREIATVTCTRGTQKAGFVGKTRCLYSCTFKLRSPSKACPAAATRPPRGSSRGSEQGGHWWTRMPSAVSRVTSSTSAKCFPLGTFFILGNKKQHRSWRDGVTGEGGQGGQAGFDQKLLSAQHGAGRWGVRPHVVRAHHPSRDGHTR